MLGREGHGSHDSALETLSGGSDGAMRGALVLDVQHKVGATIPSKRLLSHTIPEPSSCAPSGRERTSFERNRGGAMVVMRGASLRVQSQVVLAPWVPIRWSPNVTFIENTTPTPARAKSRSISTFTHGARSGARERRAQHLKPLKSDAYIPHGHVLHSRTCVENETHMRSVRPHS